MSEKIKKLIAQEFKCKADETYTFPAGYCYIHLVDPETGRIYEPIPGWEVTGDDLGKLFREVENDRTDP